MSIWPSLLLASLAGLIAPGCSDAPEEAPATASGPPELTLVTAERTDLLFRYRADAGTFATATRVDEIPAAARGSVQVVDLSRTPEERAAARFAQVFDLRRPGPDQHFSGRLIPRAELEAALARRDEPPPQRPVTMYSASWCGVCKKARAFLEKERVRFTEKDIEKDPAAARELAEKGRRQGVPTSGVPVFDVGGQLLNGFDAGRLLTLIRR